jgi:hypothetical protein
MRPSVFFRYPSGKYARDRPVTAGLRPALWFAVKFFLLTVAVILALFFTTLATREPLPPGPAVVPPPAASADFILTDIRSRWPWRLVPPEWIIKPGAVEPLVAAEVTWLRVEGRARLFVIVTVYLLGIGFLSRRHGHATPAMASTSRTGRNGHTAGHLRP